MLAQFSIHQFELFVRMLAATVVGGLIGWERKVENRRFGVRIHMLTSLAAAGFSIGAFESAAWARSQNFDADPLRVIEAVVSALALLAAGTIIKAKGHITGLTTGVGLWLAGAVGIAAGSGLYAAAILIAVLSLAILYGLRTLAD